MTIKNLVSDLLNSCARKRVDVLCGSGISLNSGLPTAIQLLNELFDGMSLADFDVDRRDLVTTLPFEAIIECAIEYGDGTTMLEMFGDKSIEPSAIHHFLAQGLANGRLERVFTTNFDLLIERAAQSSGQSSVIRRLYAGNKGSRLGFDEANANLIKLHGSADDIDSMKITLGAIAKRTNLQAVEEQVHSMLSSHRESRIVVILGYSCSDHFDIVPAIESFSGDSAELVFVQHEPNQSNWKFRDISTVQKLGNNLNPFKRFHGYHIEIDTNEFLSTWGMAQGSARTPSTFDWRARTTSLVTSLRKVRGKFLGTLHFRVGQYEVSDRCYRLGKAECKKSDEMPFILNQLALLNHILGRESVAAQFMVEAQQSATAHRNDMVISNLHEIRAELNLRNGDHVGALDEYWKSAELRAHMKNDLLLAKAYQGMSIVFRHRGDHARSLEYTDKALALLTKTPDFALQSDLLANRGELLGLQRNFVDATACLAKAIEIKTKIGDREPLCVAYIALGTMLKNRGLPDEALEAYSKAEELAKEYDFRSQLPKINLQLAILHLSIRQDISSAERHLRLAAEQFEALNDMLGLAKCESLFGQLYLHGRRCAISSAQELLARGEPARGSAEAIVADPKFDLNAKLPTDIQVKWDAEIQRLIDAISKADESSDLACLYMNLGKAFENGAEYLLGKSVSTLKILSPAEAELLVARFGLQS